MDNFKLFKAYLKGADFLKDEDCALFEGNLLEMNFEKQDYFLQESKICRYLGFVCKGLFRVFYYNEDGKEINTRFVMENDFIVDYSSFLDRKPSRYYIQALEPSEVLAFTPSMLNLAYKQSKSWERFGRLIAESAFQQTTQRMESFLFMDAETRYLNMMEEQPTYLDRIPLYQLASYLGVERESLSRIRKKIAKERGL
jgi:CRP/FNR family transcriptional regulator